MTVLEPFEVDEVVAMVRNVYGGRVSFYDGDVTLGDDPALIIPGHDPAVMSLFQAPSPELEGIAVRLDA
jgi:hypothetical protein